MRDVSTRPEKLGWVAGVFALLLLVCGAILGQAAQCTAMVPAGLSAPVLLAFSLVAAGRARFNRRQAEEETQCEEYRRTRASAELFEESDEAVKLVARANRQYVQYFVPVATVLVGVGLLAACLLFWFHWDQAILFPEAKQPFRFAVLAVAICIGCVIAGSYLLGVSREAGCRWLRPAGAWLFLVAGGLAGLYFYLAGLPRKGKRK